MERLSVEIFKQYVEEFMIKNDIRGLEIIRPTYENEIYFRAAGKGRSNSGMEIWLEFNSYLKGRDKEKVDPAEFNKPKHRIHETITY